MSEYDDIRHEIFLGIKETKSHVQNRYDDALYSEAEKYDFWRLPYDWGDKAKVGAINGREETRNYYDKSN